MRVPQKTLLRAQCQTGKGSRTSRCHAPHGCQQWHCPCSHWGWWMISKKWGHRLKGTVFVQTILKPICTAHFLRANKLFQAFSARCVKGEKTARLQSHRWILWLPQLQTLRTFQKSAEIHHWENQVHRKLALRRKILPTDQCKVDDNFAASKCRLYAGLDGVNDRVFCGQRDIPAQGSCVNHDWNEHFRSLCRTLHSYLIGKRDELWSHSLLIDPKEDLYQLVLLDTEWYVALHSLHEFYVYISSCSKGQGTSQT